MAVKICPSCGGKVASSRTTCSHCSYSFDATKICPECEESIDANEQECPICGHEFEKAPLSEVPEMETPPQNKPIATDYAPEQATTSNNMVSTFFKKTTKEQFLRSLFYHITKDSNSPVDILNAKFGEVEEGEAQGFAVYGTANGHYSASVGYDRKEKYTEQEYGFVASGRHYTVNGHPKIGDGTNVYHDVEKTRIVTDWTAFNGNITNEEKSAIVVEPEYKRLEHCFYQLLKRHDLDDLHEEHPDPQEVSHSVYNQGKTALAQAAKNGIHYPGDQVKDVSCNVSISDYKIFRCIVPTYKVTYEYDGEKYYAEGFAIEDCTPYFNLPLYSTAPTETLIREQEKKAVEIVTKPSKAVPILLAVMAILGVCSFVVGIAYNFLVLGIGFATAACCAIVSIVISIVTSKKEKQVHAAYDAKVEKLKILKGLLLNKKFTEYGFEKISSTERIYLDLTDADLSQEDFDIDSLLSTPEETVSNSTVSTPPAKKSGALIMMWSSLAFTGLGYVINMILALCIGGFLRWMFDYILAGYIAGFICMGIGLIVFIISLISHLKNKETKSKKSCIIAAILMNCLLCITFAPLLKSDGFVYFKNPDGTYIISDYKREIGTEFEIPATYNGTPITRIYSKVFDDCTELRKVTISSNISSIYSDAFRDCSSLTYIEVADNNPYYKDIDGNLYSKDGTVLVKYAAGKTDTSFTVPYSVTKIDSYAFYNCTNLTSIIIPHDVTIYSGAFYGCQIEEAIIPSGACGEINNPRLKKLTIISGSSIYTGSLSKCTSLENLTISDSVTSIASDVFDNCTGLTSVTCPASALYSVPKTSLKTVTITSGDMISYGLEGCYSLTSVVISDSVKVIAASVFKDATNLTSVYYMGTPDDWDDVAVGQNNAPFDEANLYFYSENMPSGAGKYWHYDIYGNVVVW